MTAFQKDPINLRRFKFCQVFCLSASNAPTSVPSLPCHPTRGFAIRCLQTLFPITSFRCLLPATSTGHCRPQSPLSAILGSDGFVLWDWAKDGCRPSCPHGLYFWLKMSIWVLLKRRTSRLEPTLCSRMGIWAPWAAAPYSPEAFQRISYQGFSFVFSLPLLFFLFSSPSAA